MKREFLKGLKLEGDVVLPKEVIDAIMEENGKDIEREKSRATEAITENETLKANKKTLEDKITELSESSKTADDYKSQLEKLQKDIADKEKADNEAKADKELTDSITALFGDKKFTSEYVKNGIIADMKSEIAKSENKGKGYSEIFESLTKDKDGIFANPNQPGNMSGMGNVSQPEFNDNKIREVMGLPLQK